MSTQPSLLAIQLLGDFQVTDRHGQQLLAESERLQALLAYLVLHSRAPQPRQHVAFLFWPDTQEAQARTNLRNLLHRLRRLLPQADAFIHADATLIAWRSDGPFVCDALAFDAAVEEAETHLQGGQHQAAEAALRRAVQLYRGDLLPGHYDEWLLPLRERLRQRAFRALEMLTRLLEERQAWQEAIRYGQTWLRLDPLNEQAYRCLMRLHTAQGNRAAALQAYHTCVTTLQRELGVEPDEVTQTLYRQLLQREPGDLPEPTARRPAPLIGRDEAWRRLLGIWRAVRRGQFPPQCVLITGEAGIGKSRLAEEFVQWAKRQNVTTATAHAPTSRGPLAFEPVAAWLRSLPPPSLPPAWQVEVARLLPDLLPDVSVQPGPLREAWQRQRFFEALTRAILSQPQPLLLLLDDAHQADEETLEWLHYLFRYDVQARLLLLLTARHDELAPDHPLSALAHGLQGRGQWTVLPLARLSPAQTARLAANLVGHDLPAETAAALYRHTGGTPLFIVEYVNSGLATLPADAPLPEQARALLLAHLQQLSPQAHLLAEAAAVLGRSFTTDLLARLTELDEDRLVRALDELWQRRLFREEGPATYAFSHDKLREAVYEQLGPARRQALHGQAAQALQSLSPHDLRGQAFHQEQAGHRQAALALYVQAARQEMNRFAYHAARELLHHARTLADDSFTPLLVDIWLLLAEIADVLGQPADAQQAITQALRLAHTVGAPPQQARAQYVAGLLATKTGQHPEASVYFEQALKLAQTHQDPTLALDILLAWGELSIRCGDMATARRHFEEARGLARETQAAAQEAEALDGLGFIYPALGEPPERAEQALRQALALRRAVGDQLGEARALCNLTSLLQSRGAHDQALQVGQKALAQNEAVGYRRGMAAIQGAMGLAASALGDFAAATTFLQDARQTLEVLGDVVGVTITTANLGLVAERAHHLAEAAHLYREALDLAVDHGAALFAAIVRHDLARIHVKREAWQEALALLPAAERYFQETGDRLYTQSCRTLWGRALLALGQRPRARELAEGCWQAWQEGGWSGELLPDWLWHLADLLAALGETQRARQVLAAAYAHLEEAAAAIQDETRRRAFFEQVHVHRCICEAHADWVRRAGKKREPR
ncbi:MAG: hypothetical protein KatS3mg050_1251 [Litorilinea sp.]|nr:MAG: hypothetical protein KatS3mg050_1251 [Litorilinea sp.]